ncbi:transposase [Ktedonospora formicarum]|uniref:Tc1-like transposase DDE domain-containing protein n=1 Tax=Ktedonospora formicarum TaxID=2778364 RepID=A0A8J3I658_9CHLR|nr:transposase [Ktedonospora formicarum]GHO50294.1 hypothetical protein KSX_84570 [Ktedonospora formicarum]
MSSTPAKHYLVARVLLMSDQNQGNTSAHAILHPWLKKELATILKQCPPAPEQVQEGCRWQDWDFYPSADQLDRFFPPIRVLLILDNLMGHRSHDLVQWCAEHGICLFYTPNAGSWLNMAESVQRIIVRRALEGHHIYDVEILKDWLREAIAGWNRHPTPFLWGGKRHARRDRAYARRHRLGDRERHPCMSSHNGFVPCASTSMSLTSTELANDPLGTAAKKIRIFILYKIYLFSRSMK